MQYRVRGIVDRRRPAARRLGAKLLRLDVLESTNRTLRELASGGEPEGTVVVAEFQSAGRGRLDRSWVSPKGGLWFSVLLRPGVPATELPQLTLMAGTAVGRALIGTLGLRARLKWPNDVLVGGRKLCGILAESGSGGKGMFVVVGIGINVNFLVAALPPELRRTATTVKQVLLRPVNRIRLLRAVLNELEVRYSAFCDGDHTSVLEEWMALSDTIGKRVRVETHSGVVEGLARDIDSGGALVVATGEGDVAVGTGDCIHLE